MLMMTLELIGDLALTTFIWTLIIFFLMSSFTFLSFWARFFREALERKKAWMLKYQTVESYFMLHGKEIDDDEIEHLEKRAREVSAEKNILVKDDDMFHESVLEAVYVDWCNIPAKL